jgi:hypothetical protein
VNRPSLLWPERHQSISSVSTQWNGELLAEHPFRDDQPESGHRASSTRASPVLDDGLEPANQAWEALPSSNANSSSDHDEPRLASKALLEARVTTTLIKRLPGLGDLAFAQQPDDQCLGIRLRIGFREHTG